MKKYYIIYCLILVVITKVYSNGYRCYVKFNKVENNVAINNDNTQTTNTVNGNINNSTTPNQTKGNQPQNTIIPNVPIIKAPTANTGNPNANPNTNTNTNTQNNNNNQPIINNPPANSGNNNNGGSNSGGNVSGGSSGGSSSSKGGGLKCSSSIEAKSGDNCASIVSQYGLGSYYNLRKINLTLDCGDKLSQGTKVCIKASPNESDYQRYSVKSDSTCDKVSSDIKASSNNKYSVPSSYIPYLIIDG